MDISISHTQGKVPVTIMRINGDLDATAYETFEPKAKNEISSGSNDLLIDLSGVPFMSSAGIRVINSLYYQLHPYTSEENKKRISRGVRDGTYEAPHLKLLKPNKRVLEVLKLVGVDMYLGIYSNEQNAISAFNNNSN